MTNTSDFNPGVLLVGLLLIIGFMAIFTRQHRWDRNEQFYKELKARETSDSGETKKN